MRLAILLLVLAAQAAHVCVSRATEDADFAEVLALRLARAGVSAWTADDIPTGAEWRREIDRQMARCRVLVIVASPDAATSQYVSYEMGFALGRRLRLVPVLVRGGELPERIAGMQYLDFRSRAARPWRHLIAILRTP